MAVPELSIDTSTAKSADEDKIIIVESLPELPVTEKVSIKSIKLNIEKMDMAILKAKTQKNKLIDLLVAIDASAELKINIMDIPKKEII